MLKRFVYFFSRNMIGRIQPACRTARPATHCSALGSPCPPEDLALASCTCLGSPTLTLHSDSDNRRTYDVVRCFMWRI